MNYALGVLKNNQGYVVLDLSMDHDLAVSYFRQEVQRCIMNARKEFVEMRDWCEAYVSIPNDYVKFIRPIRDRLEENTHCGRIIFYDNEDLRTFRGAEKAVSFNLKDFDCDIQVFMKPSDYPEEIASVKKRLMDRKDKTMQVW